MKIIHGYAVEKEENSLCYKISGNDVPNDMKILIYFENGRYRAESNYKKKPTSGCNNSYQPLSQSFTSEDKALDNLLSLFASSSEPFVKEI